MKHHPRITAATRNQPATDHTINADIITRETQIDSAHIINPNLNTNTNTNTNTATEPISINALLCTFLDCSFDQLQCETVNLERSHSQHCSIQSCSCTQLNCAHASLSELHILNSRVGVWDAIDSAWNNVVIENCRIRYCNLRGACLRDCIFQNCQIDEFDAVDSQLTRVSFDHTEIGRLDLHHARIDDVDLRQAHLNEIAGVEYLRGTTMTLEQISDLAEAFAQSLGIYTQ